MSSDSKLIIPAPSPGQGFSADPFRALLSPDIWQYIDHLVARRVYEALEEERKRRREWWKSWPTWIGIVIALLTATGAWTSWHLVQSEAKREVLEELRVDYPEKAKSLDKAVSDLDASKKVNDQLVKTNESLINELSKLKSDFIKTQSDFVQTQSNFDVLTTALDQQKKNVDKLTEQFAVAGAALKDTVSATTSLVPDITWKELALPVGSVLFVRPSTVESVTGQKIEWWNNRKNNKTWGDNSFAWVPFERDAHYIGSQLDGLPERDGIFRDATSFTAALNAFPSAKGVLLIRINGPLP